MKSMVRPKIIHHLQIIPPNYILLEVRQVRNANSQIKIKIHRVKVLKSLEDLYRTVNHKIHSDRIHMILAMAGKWCLSETLL